jgi:hypothetical protein
MYILWQFLHFNLYYVGKGIRISKDCQLEILKQHLEFFKTLDPWIIPLTTLVFFFHGLMEAVGRDGTIFHHKLVQMFQHTVTPN